MDTTNKNDVAPDVGGLTDAQIEAKFAAAYYPPKEPGNELLQRVYPGDLVKVARSLLATKAAAEAAPRQVVPPEFGASAGITPEYRAAQQAKNEAASTRLHALSAPVPRVGGNTCDLTDYTTAVNYSNGTHSDLAHVARQPKTDDLPLGYFSKNGGSSYAEVDPKFKDEPDVIALFAHPVARQPQAAPTEQPDYSKLPRYTIGHLGKVVQDDQYGPWVLLLDVMGSPSSHPDDCAVNRFAAAMKAKLTEKREQGRGGWETPECTDEYLAELLMGHTKKGDPVDVANFAMMLHQRNVGHMDIAVLALRSASLQFAMRTAPMFALGSAPQADDLDMQTIRARDYNAEIADKLADGIAEHFGQDIGEHSSANCPWLRALDILNTKPEFLSCKGTERAAVPKWEPVTRAGQVKKGDKLRFKIGDTDYNQRAKQILHAGTDKEEVIYDKGRNFYFITSMVINGGSNHKQVEVLAAPVAQEGEQSAKPLRYTGDGALAECPCCGSLDVGGAHDTVHCYACGLMVKAPRPLQNAIDKWNRRTGATSSTEASAQDAPADLRDAAELVRIRTIIEVSAAFDSSSMQPITENDACRRILALRSTSTPTEGTGE